MSVSKPDPIATGSNTMRIAAIMPGPPRTLGPGVKLPEPPPAGQLPPEDSPLWVFTAKAVRTGEPFIQEDTREWFEDRQGAVQITRWYDDHPRWLISGRESVRAKMHNAHIVSEIHMLARVSKGMTDVPAWVPARMNLKQQQADVAFRLTKAARTVFLKHGVDALEAFAMKAPGQFIKFIGNTFIPKRIEAAVEVSDATEALTRDQADNILSAIADEMQRRQAEAKTIVGTPLDYEAPAEIGEAMHNTGVMFHQAVSKYEKGYGGQMDGTSLELATGLRRMKDYLTTTDETEQEWD